MMPVLDAPWRGVISPLGHAHGKLQRKSQQRRGPTTVPDRESVGGDSCGGLA